MKSLDSSVSGLAVGAPLNLIINPPEILSGLPGELVQLVVIVQNSGNRDASIDISLRADNQVLQWCCHSNQRLGLGQQQSGEVVFEFNLPSSALPGTFNYTIVVDAPLHYPDHTPIQFTHQLRVLSKEHTAVGLHDSTFFLKPATNSQQPASLKPGEILLFEVEVENRSGLVDQFRLLGEDTEENWLTIHYPVQDKNSPGYIQQEDYLNLNPGERGTIRLEVHPPIDTLAGLYSPTLRLHSARQPDLKRLDFIYLNIEPIETCEVELISILERVSHRSGEYQIRLINQGNVFRQFKFSASNREEAEFLTYNFEPEQLRLPPGREAQVALWATPRRQWQRPWLRPRSLPFQIELHDAQGYQLPTRQLQAVLVWQSRPWWQLILAALLVLGLLSGIGLAIWWLFFKPPAPVVVENFSANSLEYTEGDSVRLSWSIQNPQRIQALKLTTQTEEAASVKPIEAKTFEFTHANPPADLPDRCPEVAQLCQQYELGKLAAGRYELVLQPTVRSGDAPEPERLTVLVAAKPDPQIVRFEPEKSEYSSGENPGFNWVIQNVSQLAGLTLTTSDSANRRVSQTQYTFQSGIDKRLQDFCQRQGETLTCRQVSVTGLRSGAYTFQLQTITVKGKAIQSAPTPTVTLKPQPLRIVDFVVNGRRGGGNVKLLLNQALQISWRVEGGEGPVQVNIAPYGNFPAAGAKDFGKFAAPGNHQIQITATDTTGQQVAGAGFLVSVVAPPAPARPLTPPRR